MLSFLLAYATGEGQTAKVATRVDIALAERGHEATTVELGKRGGGDDVDIEAHDAVLVGASIHMGKHQKAVRRFVETHREALAGKPTAFFQVSLSSATEEGADQAAQYAEELFEATDWHPDRIGLFGGALRFSEYGLLTRFMMKRIARENLPYVDTSTDTEFTDWKDVDAFANDVAAFVEGRLGVTPPKAD
jgi:menaquinone-dependent protoporphyrinogen oxidase